MALLAKRLPVVLIPKKSGVTSMRDNVINYSGFHVPAFAGTFDTERMRLQKAFAFPLPFFSVPSVRS